MNFSILFDNVGLGFLVVTALYMIWFGSLKWSVLAGFIFSAIVVADRLLSFYVHPYAGLVFMFVLAAIFVWLEYRKKPK